MGAHNPVSELIARNQAYFAGKQVLLAGDIAGVECVSALSGAAAVTIICDDFPAASRIASALGQSLTQSPAQQLKAGRFTLIYAEAAAAKTWLKPQYDALLLLLTKSKQLNAKLLHELAPLVPNPGLIYTAGTNAGGGKSADSLLKPAGSPFKADSARKCTLFGVVPQNPFPAPADLPAFSFNQLKVEQAHGVFSAGRPDEGTRMLLSVLPQVTVKGAAALDLCCGCGIIALHLQQAGMQVSAADASANALALCARNAKVNQMPLRIYAADMLSGLGQYELIAVNPPFHTGLSRNTSPTLNMFADAAAHLKPQGRLLVVGNTFLHYPDYLKNYFKQVQVLKSDPKFTVVLASDPLNV